MFAPEDIGARIAQARRESGLTQEELADLAGVSTRSWQGYEAGEVVPYKHMARISEITRRSVAWLIHGDIEEDASVRDRLERIEGQLGEILVALDKPDGDGAVTSPVGPRRSPAR